MLLPQKRRLSVLQRRKRTVQRSRALLLPQYAEKAYWRLFAPEFRDLVLEAQYHGLGPQMELLQAHRIPTSERTLPLHKDAPREIEPRTLLSSCLGSCRRRGGGGPQA